MFAFSVHRLDQAPAVLSRLLAAFPARPANIPANAVVIDLPAGALPGGEGAAAGLPAPDRVGGRPVLLRLPAEWALRKRLVLPLAAGGDLPRLLGYEMERETPFAPDEIWWTHRLLGRDKKAGTIEVELILVPRAPVAPVLARLREAGIEAAAVAVPDAGGGFTSLPLAAAGPPLVFDRVTRRLGLLAALLAMVAILLPFLRQTRDILPAAGGVAADGIAALAGRDGQRLGNPLALLEAATRLLPDDSYLTDFTLQDGQVTLTGYAPDAAKLVASLAGSAVLRDPALAAPVVPNGPGGLESFTIKTGFSRLAAGRPVPDSAPLVLEAGNGALAAAALQSRLKEIIHAAGASLTSAEALPEDAAQGGFRRVAIHLSLAGGLGPLTAVLKGIAESRPLLFVDMLQLHAGGPEQLDILMDAHAYRPD